MATIASNLSQLLVNLVSNKPKSAKISLDQFELEKCLGEGCSGKVYRVHLKADPEKHNLVLKMIDSNNFSCSKQNEHLSSEIGILQKVSHPFIIKLVNNFEKDGCHYLLFEYLSGGDLHDRLTETHRFSPENTKFYIAQILLALQYLHRNDIVFRDLKPENILLDKAGYVKLADFGFSKVLKNNSRTFTLCGTPEYLSPEFLTKKKEGYGRSVDWWALGVLIYEMLVGETPFVADTPCETYRRIIRGEIYFPKYIDSASKSVILKLLNPNVEERLGCGSNGEDMKAHPFFENICFQGIMKKSVKAPLDESKRESFSSLKTDISLNSEKSEVRFSEVEYKFGIFDCVCL